jgi:hypothetical protein
VELQLWLSIAVSSLLLIAGTRPILAAQSDYVPRTKGWMMLIPPLGSLDRSTGERRILKDTPKKKWTGIVIRGYDGKAYDFVDQDTCQVGMSALVMKLYEDNDPQYRALSLGKCVQDDGRRNVVIR